MPREAARSVWTHLLAVSLLLWMLIIVSVNTNTIKRNLSDSNVTSLSGKIISPYPKIIELLDDNQSLPPEIENAIKQKVQELKSMLQDYDQIKKSRRDNNLNKEGSAEIIIEFEPANTVDTNSVFRKQTKQTTDTFQQKIENYKQLSQNITKLLDKVSIPSSTKKLITGSLHEMLALLIKRQCQLNGLDITHLVKYSYFTNSTRKSMPELTNIAMKILRQAAPFYEFHDKTGNMSEIMQMILPQLLEPINKLINKYKLVCYLHHKEDPLFLNAGINETFDQGNGTKDPCNRFIICTDELTNFLNMSYKTLKVTATNVFKDYTDMYHRDIKNETVYTHDSIILKLDALKNFAETKVKEIFLKELKDFKLDKNKNKTANIEYIKDFTKALTSKSKCGINTQVDRELTALRNKTLITIRDDLTMDMKQAMDRLSELLSDKICSYFVNCNGISRATTNLRKRRAFRPRDAKNVYVEVQRRVNDELKDSITHFGEQSLDFRRGDMTPRLGNSVNNAMLDQGKYNNVKVTRTTMRTTATTEGIVSGENSITEQFF